MTPEQDIEWVDRVRHVSCRARTCDDELAFARTIQDGAQTIEIVTQKEPDPGTRVTVYGREGVYHFRKLRADYEGHASRTLLAVLEHFGLVLPLSFVLAYPTQTIYVAGAKVVAEDLEFRLGKREEGSVLVEELRDWWMASRAVETLLAWAREYGTDPVVLLEQTIALLAERLESAAVPS